jgi:hypothetical protein
MEIFGTDQWQAYEAGKLKRERLTSVVDGISSDSIFKKYPHTYIYSPAGLGKSFIVRNHLRTLNMPHCKISGVYSMFAFGIQLAVINHQNPDRTPIILFADDCDGFFSNEINCNIMKNVLEGERVFTYAKYLSSQMGNLSSVQREAVSSFTGEGNIGFSVPTENIVFIFTSNVKLPTDDEVARAHGRLSARASLLRHRSAIRSRCTVLDFDLSFEQHWGWISDVVLNTDCLAAFKFQERSKYDILCFLWDNWKDLSERSIRLVEKMAKTMDGYPDTYKKLWELDYVNIRR